MVSGGDGWDFITPKEAKYMKNALICTATAQESDRLKIMLIELGFAQILESNDFDRAFSLAVDHVPDVAIIDIAASGKDLLQALKSIRAKLNIPVILVGSAFSPDSIELAIAAGAGGFLAKPIRKEELWPAIEVAAVHNHELEELKEKVAALEGALENRKSVEKAKGMLMREHGLSEPDAFRRMQKLAMDKRTTLLKIAEAILLTECGGGRGTVTR
jgi:AmiR/NasT family two-component response regulator